VGRPARTLSWLVFTSLACASMACGDERQPAPPDQERMGPRARAATQALPTGTTFEIRTHTALSIDRNRSGDAFTAAMIGPLVDDAGAVIVPGDAIVRGRVTGVTTPAQFDQPAVLYLAFEAISFAGHSYPLQATIEQVLGRTGIRALRGAAAGSVTGTGIAIDRQNGDAIFPRGTDLLIRLIEPVAINRRSPGVR
jgi:hypothetical protein